MRPATAAPGAASIADIIPGRFVFSVTRFCQRNSGQPVAFTIEGDCCFAYQPFFSDFGLLALHQIHLFVDLALSRMPERQGEVQFYCSSSPQHIANALLLAASFRLIHLRLPPGEALEPFAAILPRARPYRDASSFPSPFELTVSSCVHALSRAMSLGWYAYQGFDPVAWAAHEQVEKGDMNWIIPGKLLAFASPYQTSMFQGFRVCTPHDIIPVFRAFGITTIVRLNNRTYDEKLFKDAGFRHLEMVRWCFRMARARPIRS
jgi:cell division cycle 14